ncbi:MAG: BatA domain-containing protein [Pirellulales bacterium]|nr:BatA domain-containing protein [Pirellulales bacterium]
MESLFLNPSLIFLGLPLLALPIIIHLINLMRHRRIQWAAMEFLLAAYKKSKTWVILKQLILLLMRIAAVAAIMFIVAQPMMQGGLDFLGGEVTHHIVLLDDSYSMSDVHGTESAYEIAQRGVMQIANKAATARGAQEFTLLRFSEAVQENPELDTNSRRVAADFESTLEPVLGRHEASQTASGPEAALDSLGRVLDEGRDENRIVYIVSDFRQNEWESAGALRDKINRLKEQGVQVKLIRVVDKENENLTITSLAAVPGVRATNVPIELEVTVKNNGKNVKRNVAVALTEDGLERSGVTISEIQPGAEESRRFSVFYQDTGSHWVEARLPNDEVHADNHRYWAVDLPLEISVLICDEDPEHRSSHYLDIVLNARADELATGITTRIEHPRYLSDHDLSSFQSIYITNFSRLEDAAVAALEDYVQNGGGVAFFLGDDTQARWVTENLYRNGEGLFPVPIASKVGLLFDSESRTPDLVPNLDHPVFRVFGISKNSFLNKVTISKYWALQANFEAKDDLVLCRLRNNAPLVVENRSFGSGRVVTYLMSIDNAPADTLGSVDTQQVERKSNWTSNPSFVVSMMMLQSYLSKQKEGSFEIGAPFDVDNLSVEQFGADVEFARMGQYPMTIKVQAIETTSEDAENTSGETDEVDEDSDVTPVSLVDSGQDSDDSTLDSGTQNSANPDENTKTRTAKFEETDIAGVYEARLQSLGSSLPMVRIRSYNVDPAEGRLAITPTENLAASINLDGVEILNIADLGGGSGAAQQSNMSQYLLYGLILLLIGEQMLAYWASYHTPIPGGTR